MQSCSPVRSHFGSINRDYYVHDTRPASHAWHLMQVGSNRRSQSIVTDVTCYIAMVTCENNNTCGRVDALTHSEPHEFSVSRVRQKRSESSSHLLTSAAKVCVLLRIHRYRKTRGYSWKVVFWPCARIKLTPLTPHVRSCESRLNRIKLCSPCIKHLFFYVQKFSDRKISKSFKFYI